MRSSSLSSLSSLKSKKSSSLCVVVVVDENNSNHNHHTPSSSSSFRRKSSLASLFYYRGAPAPPPTPNSDDDDAPTNELAQAISSPARRSALIQAQLGSSTGHAAIVAIRFVAAVDQFAQTKPRQERDLLGRNICGLFVTGKDMFRVRGLSAGTQHRLAIKGGEVAEDALLAARQEVLAWLVLVGRV